MQTDNQQDTTALTRTRKPQNDHRKAIQNARRAYGVERSILLNLRMHNAHACYPQENGQPYVYGHQRERALDLRNAWVLEKTPEIF